MTQPPSTSRPLVAGRYQLQGELGRGGMATVYLALDLRHGRKVALKVLRQDLAAAIGPDRFLREIEITAGLNHPHVLPLLDSGEAEGILYYVMPFVAGGSLRRLLGGEQEIPLEAVLRIVREVASALDYAHSRGVVHRDVKPENVLFVEGLAVVSDFGIARVVSSAPPQAMTRTGVAVGTLGYMSPEQALGTGELDARSDVFSLGCVVYEMLTGGTPTTWLVPDEVRMGRITEVPLSHRLRLDRLPGRVEQVLTRALALRPGDRFSAAGELAEALVKASEKTTAFSEEEVRRLLDRAAELQALEPLDPGALTIGGVEQIAAEVGIPPEHVRAAARELAGRASRAPVPMPKGRALEVRAPGGLAGSAPRWPRRRKWDRVVASRIVEGEIPESAFPAMVEEIQDRLGILGHATVLARSLTWSPATQSEDSRRLVVSVRVRGGATEIRVEEDFGLGGIRKVVLPGGIFLGAGFGALLSTLLGLGPALVVPGAILGVPVAIRTLTRIESNSRRPQLEELAGRLREMVDEALDEER